MQLKDLLPLEKWVMFENKINNKSGLNAAVFDSEGQRITAFVSWANQLCPIIKADKQGQSYICALAHQNVAVQAKKMHKPVAEECDAGLTKLVVPIFTNNEFLGVASVCGYLSGDNEIDTFMINKTIAIDERELKNKSVGIPVMTHKQIEPLIEFIQKEVEQIVIAYENR